MKVCPICQSTYEETVDFCFKDGAPLEALAAAVDSRSDYGGSLDGITADDLDAPDAISLSNIPAVDVDDEAVTQTLPIDLPDAEELDRSADRLDAIEGPPERDVTGIVDPFGGHDEELFRARLADGSASKTGAPSGPPRAAVDVPEDLPSAGLDADLPPEPAAVEPPPAAARKPVAVPAAAAPEAEPTVVEAPAPGPAATAPGPETARPARTPAAPQAGKTPSAAATPQPARQRPQADRPRPRMRPEDFGQPRPKDRRGLIVFVCAVGALIAIAGWQFLRSRPGPTQVADAGGVEPRTATPVPTPAPTVRETPAPVEATPEQTPEPITEEPAPQATPDARQEEERRRLEEERRRQGQPTPSAVAARTPAPTPRPTAAPEPPFNAGGQGRETPTVAAGGNPWAAGGTPTPTPAAGQGSPWGGAQPAQAEVTISTQPAGARVSVGGRFRGTAPLKLTLDPGTHEVRVEQQGFATQTRYLKVDGSGPVGLDVVLEALVRAVQGTLMVASSPVAMLSVDGVLKGRTPISIPISSGSHRFKLETDDGRVLDQTVPIDVAEGATVNKFFAIP